MVLVNQSAASTTSPEAAATPISNWGPSWTASSIQSTLVAVTCQLSDGNPAAVVILKPGNTKQSTGTASSLSQVGGKPTSVDSIPVLQHGLGQKHSDRWSLVGPTTFCCMTGLASDIDYLTRILLKHAETHRLIYEGSHRLPTAKVVHLLAENLQKEARYQGGRPFGIQTLLLGSTRANPLALWTLDPSGGMRHWGCATAVGKEATEVRKRLYEALREESTIDVNVALRSALCGILAGGDDGSETTDSLDELPEALLVWKKENCLRVATIEQETVQKSRKEAMARIKSRKQKTT